MISYFYVIRDVWDYMSRDIVASVRGLDSEMHYSIRIKLRAICNEPRITSVRSKGGFDAYAFSTFGRWMTVHPDYDRITQQLGEAMPDVRHLIIVKGYPGMPIQDGALPVGYADLLHARKAFKYRQVFRSYTKSGPIHCFVQRRGVNPISIRVSRDA